MSRRPPFPPSPSPCCCSSPLCLHWELRNCCASRAEVPALAPPLTPFLPLRLPLSYCFFACLAQRNASLSNAIWQLFLKRHTSFIPHCSARLATHIPFPPPGPFCLSLLHLQPAGLSLGLARVLCPVWGEGQVNPGLDFFDLMLDLFTSYNQKVYCFTRFRSIESYLLTIAM